VTPLLGIPVRFKQAGFAPALKGELGLGAVTGYMKHMLHLSILFKNEPFY